MSRRGVLHERLPPPVCDADMHELATVAAGAFDGSANSYVRGAVFARRGLLRMVTQARWDGLEIAAGWPLTLAGHAELSAWEARARDARAEAPQEVARGGAAHAARAPSHDYQQGR